FEYYVAQAEHNAYNITLLTEEQQAQMKIDTADAVGKYLDSERVRKHLNVSSEVGAWVPIVQSVSEQFIASGDIYMNFH
ncbi:hypothetical protein PybrP1_000310, partial [[Pythium] brassicae (nom. inval.)]